MDRKSAFLQNFDQKTRPSKKDQHFTITGLLIILEVAYLGWVDFDLILPNYNSAKHWTAQADPGRQWSDQNQCQPIPGTMRPTESPTKGLGREYHTHNIVYKGQRENLSRHVPRKFPKYVQTVP